MHADASGGDAGGDRPDREPTSVLHRDGAPGAPGTPGTLWTVGHSTRSIEELLALLAGHRVEQLMDVRRFPGSRRLPHFGQVELSAVLAAAGIGYTHEPDLGGRRAAQPGPSPNGAWRSASFRAYADHMATPAFRAALDRVLGSAAERGTVVMCAEAVPWTCHRQLIADAAVARGWRVLHILDLRRADAHVLRAGARVARDGTVTYPTPGDEQTALL